jgi:hypothetical protein
MIFNDIQAFMINKNIPKGYKLECEENMFKKTMDIDKPKRRKRRINNSGIQFPPKKQQKIDSVNLIYLYCILVWTSN